MKNGKKKLWLALSAAILVLSAVAGTIAYFTDNDSDANTFTVGNVKITLDEAKTDENGEPVAGADRVTANTYKLLPGSSYTKDPTVHVADNSGDCWVFVKVVNEIEAIESAGKTVAGQMAENGWTLVPGETNVYAYKEAVEGGTDLPVFESFDIDGDSVTGSVLEAYEGKTITVIAYAIQAAGFGDYNAAWAALAQQLAQNG